MAPPNASIKSYLQQQQRYAAAAAAANAAVAPSGAIILSAVAPRNHVRNRPSRAIVSEQQAPPPPPASSSEIVRSYDEIDQIYDYIRGLAPLPDNLRRMKSIDFEQIEQLERQRRAHKQQQLQKHLHEQRQKQQLAAATTAAATEQQQRYLSTTDVNEQPSGRSKPAKLRQREEAQQVGAGERLTQPHSPVAVSLPAAVALRVTAGEARRPVVKRVESFNLKKQQGVELPTGNYSRNQQLLRAQSTSSLKPQSGQKPASCGATAGRHRSQRQLDSILQCELVESFVDDDEEEAEEQREEVASLVRPASHKNATSSESNSSSRSSSEKSSTTSSGGKDSQRSSSSSSSSSVASKRRAPREEHIYEQIPAHNQPSDEAHHLIAKRAIGALESDPSQKQQRPSITKHKVSQYPVAYSANVAANARYQQQVATLFACQQRQLLRDTRQQLRPTIGSQFTAAATRQQQAQPQPERKLANKAGQHQRTISMGNLHLLASAAAIPMASLWNPRKQPVAAAAQSHSMDRRSSTGRQNSRPLKMLAPAELIGQIQMPRAVTKRQVGPAPAYGSSSSHNNQQDGSWQTAAAVPVRATLKQVAAPAPELGKHPNVISEVERAARLAQKRASGRRLTAIGIEQSWDGLLSNQRALPLLVQQHREQRQAARANFFEPMRATATAGAPKEGARAPLIDADELASEASELSEGPSESPLDAAVRQNHRIAASSLQQTSAPPKSLDSTSDLQSFSSSSTSASASSSASSTPESETTPELSQSDSTQSDRSGERQEPSPLAKSDCDINVGEAHVPAARLKSYPEDAKQADNKIRPAPKVKRLGSKLFSNGERLLSLIGLDTIGSGGGGAGSGSSKGGSGDKMAARTNQTARRDSADDKQRQRAVAMGKLSLRRTSAPPTPLKVSPTSGRPLASSTGASAAAAASRRRFSSSAVNTLAERHTMAAAARGAPRPSLVSHFEHPIVEIAQVAANKQQQQQSAARTSRRPRASGELASNNSSATTNSTSSYEAAIKNSAARQPPPPTSDEQTSGRPAHSKRPSAASASLANATSQQQQQHHPALMRVPKLSKQSHLLNRPLPRLPSGTSGRHLTGSGMLQQQQQRHLASLGAGQSASSTLARVQRHLSSGKPQQANGTVLTLDRYGTARSEPSAASSAAQSRAAQRYLLAQQQQITQAHGVSNKQQQRSPLSTNLDASDPLVSFDGAAKLQKQPAGGASTSQTSLKSRASRTNSAAIQPSPTVTTYTSSGISSTHLATNVSSSSSQRSKASSSNKSAASTSSGGQALAPKPTTPPRRIASSSSNTLEGAPSWRNHDNQSEEEEDDDERDAFEMIDQRGEGASSASPDLMNFGHEQKGDDNLARRSHLKSFDERFSSKYADQHLASSDDSLLESINFSGTLESRARRQRDITTTARR